MNKENVYKVLQVLKAPKVFKVPKVLKVLSGVFFKLKRQYDFAFTDEGVQGIHRREFAHLRRIIFTALQTGAATQNGGATVQECGGLFLQIGIGFYQIVKFDAFAQQKDAYGVALRFGIIGKAQSIPKGFYVVGIHYDAYTCWIRAGGACASALCIRFECETTEQDC